MGTRAFPESLQRLSTEPCCVSEDPCSSSALYASYSVLLFVLNVSARTELGPLLCMSKPGSPDVIVLFSTPYCVLVLPLPPSHQELFQNRLLTPCRLLVSEPGKQTAERRETRTGSNQTKADEIKSPSVFTESYDLHSSLGLSVTSLDIPARTLCAAAELSGR